MPFSHFEHDAIAPSVRDEAVLTWESQATQYPSTDEPGIRYFRGEIGGGRWVDCLLHYEDTGELTGILNHYPQRIPPYEQEGAVNLWVRPDRRRQGIAFRLAVEALERWDLRDDRQRFSSVGVEFARSTLSRLTGSKYDLRESSTTGEGDTP